MLRALLLQKLKQHCPTSAPLNLGFHTDVGTLAKPLFYCKGRATYQSIAEAGMAWHGIALHAEEGYEVRRRIKP
jgi:hypothetical protein